MDVYVIGHLNPDTDAIVSAMMVAEWIRQDFGWNATPARAGEPNPETAFVFRRFSAELPVKLESGEDRDFFLVDHNEESQRLPGMDAGRIHGIVDHHKFRFSNSKPISITARPWGSSATIAYWLCKQDGVELDRKMKGLALAAMLSDTVILRSPTTTDIDRKYVRELSEELGIDYESFGMEMFRAKSRVAEMPARELITKDFKNFEFSGKKVGIGQVEVVDSSLIESRMDEIKQEMDSMRKEMGYHTLLLMVTDIMKQGSVLIASSEEMDRLESLFGKFNNGISSFQKGMLSRKKQVVPEIERGFSK